MPCCSSWLSEAIRPTLRPNMDPSAMTDLIIDTSLFRLRAFPITESGLRWGSGGEAALQVISVFLLLITRSTPCMLLCGRWEMSWCIAKYTIYFAGAGECTPASRSYRVRSHSEAVKACSVILTSSLANTEGKQQLKKHDLRGERGKLCWKEAMLNTPCESTVGGRWGHHH